jgi:Acetyltransferases
MDKDKEIYYRMADRNDINELVSNRMEFIEALKGIRPPKIFEDWTYDYLNKHMEDDDFQAWIAESNMKIISSCMLCITQQLPLPICRNGKIGYIYNVFTLKEYRNQGIATKLIKKVQDYAIENEILSLCLSASPDGFPIYQKSGFLLQEHEMRWNLNACPSSH